MNNMPLISVIVPIYKVEAVLTRCVDSLLCQTYKNLQIILIDDGSPDRCGTICDWYAEQDPRITVVHQRNGGVSAARNAGLDAVKGEWIAFVDPDDYVTADYIAYLYTLITDHNADIACCGVENVCLSGKHLLPGDQSLYVMGPREALERMCYNDQVYITLWDKLYRKALFDGVRFPVGKKFEDTGTTWEVVSRASVLVAQCVPKYFYVNINDSITTGKFDSTKLDYVEMAEVMAEGILSLYPDLRPATERKRVHACFSTLCQLAKDKERNRGIEKQLIAKIKLYRKSILRDPRAPRRDKLALLSLTFGFSFFSFCWRMYLRVAK